MLSGATLLTTKKTIAIVTAILMAWSIEGMYFLIAIFIVSKKIVPGAGIGPEFYARRQVVSRLNLPYQSTCEALSYATSFFAFFFSV